ncbi:MAG: LPS export ABC transporter permease LptF [Pseudomonadota bacterium]
MTMLVDRYLLRQILPPLIVTLCIAAMLLLLEKMLNLFDFVINEGGPVSVVWQMLGNLVPQYLGLGVPIGLFLGIMLGIRKLALASELDTLFAAGVGHLRLLRVPYGLAFLMMLLSIAITGFIQPISVYAYEELRFDLRTGALGASIRVGEFTQIGDKVTIRIDESRNNGQELLRIFAQTQNAAGEDLVITAARGAFLATENRDTILLRLFDGTLANVSTKNPTPRILTFTVHDFPIDLPPFKTFRKRGERHLEMTLPELWQAQDDPNYTKPEQQSIIANLHFRLVHMLILPVLPLLALAMSIPRKRSASALNVFAGVTILVVYNEITELGEAANAHAETPVWLSIWLPYLIFAATSARLFWITAFVPGGRPLKYLDVLGDRIGTLLKGLRRAFAQAFGKEMPS